MSPRVWLSPDIGMRISRSGYDVRYATAQQLLFDSANAMPVLYLAGSVTLTAGQTYTYTYPTTLIRPPVLFVSAYLSNGGKLQFGTGFASFNFGTRQTTYFAQWRSFRNRFELFNGFSFSISIDLQAYIVP